jgi:subtilisin family serine protease
MAKLFRVIAHAMHEDELNAAQTIIGGNAARTDAFVTGVVDEAAITRLVHEGLIVETVSELDANGRPMALAPETPGTGSALTPKGTLRSTVFTRRMFNVDDAVDFNEPQYYLIQIDGPLLEGYKQSLIALEVYLLEAFSNGFYSARLTPKQFDEVKKLNFVKDVIVYDGADTVPTTGKGLTPLAAEAAKTDVVRMLTYDVRLHPNGSVQAVKDWLLTKGVAIGGVSGRKIRVYVMENSQVLDEIAAQPDVQSLQEFMSPKLFNDRARVLLRIDNPNDPTVPFDGSGEIIAVADTGLDEMHPDFPPSRIVAVLAKGRPNDASDPNGHGTHVAGSALGDGSASAGAFKGTAPGAKLVFQSLLDSAGELGGLPLDLNDLLEEAYQHGARIHNNSWGSATASTYRFESMEVDEFVNNHRDMLVVIAAGNEGQAARRINSATGVVDWLSIGAPATAKNALTVGASRSDRTNGAYSAFQWGQAWSADFPDAPIASELISGNPECLAAFSSRGPSDDRRIKPDVVAPGTDILSCKSSRAPLAKFWGSYPQNTHYAYDGGTSMATPLVSGCAAIVRQYYRTNQNWSASAALVRATLVNGARRLTGNDANASNPPNAIPAGNFDQGFGVVDVANSIPNPASPNLSLAFVDTWADGQRQLGQTGHRRRYRLKVRAGRALRICLTYTDFPARALQNNVNLFVQAPNGKKHVGNADLRLKLGLPDGDNNVEVVRIETPAEGYYLIQIAATNLLHTPQDFALVATGELDGGLTET